MGFPSSFNCVSMVFPSVPQEFLHQWPRVTSSDVKDRLASFFDPGPLQPVRHYAGAVLPEGGHPGVQVSVGVRDSMTFFFFLFF